MNSEDILKEEVTDIFHKYINSTTFDSSDTNRPFSNERAKDLQRLKNILELLSKINANCIDKKVLYDIGVETANIIVNNSNKNYFIRNRYGLIGSKSDFNTKNGIEFIELQALRYVQDSDLDPSKLDDLYQGLQITKTKIEFAIEEETCNERKYSSAISDYYNSKKWDANEGPKLSKFTREFYTRFLMDKIKDELAELNAIRSELPVTLSKENKYMVFRIFANIGERAKEIINHNKGTEKLLEHQISILRVLKFIRDTINHSSPILISRVLTSFFLKQMADFFSSSIEKGNNDTNNSILEQNILRFFKGDNSTPKTNHMVKLICNQFSEELEVIVNNIENYCALKLDIKNSDNLTTNYASIESEYKSKIAPFEIEINNIYGQKIESLTEKSRTLESSIKILEQQTLTGPNNLQISDLQSELKVVKKKIKDEKTNIKKAGRLDDLNSRRSIIDNKWGSELKALRIEIDDNNRKKDNLEKIKKQISTLTINKFPNNTDIEKILNNDFTQEIKESLEKYKLNQQITDYRTLNKKISSKLNLISEELSYLREIYFKNDLVQKYKSLILQYSFSIIAQYSRDIEELEKNTGLYSMKSLAENAITFNESWRKTIRTRNKEISHDLDSFNEDRFLTTVRDDTLSMRRDIEAIRDLLALDHNSLILENNEDIKTGFFFNYTYFASMNNAAIYHLRLGNYDDAKKFFLEVLNYLGDQFVTVHNDTVIDFYKWKIVARSNYVEYLIATEQFEEALLQLNEVATLESNTQGKTTKITLCNQAFVLQNLRRLEEAQLKIKEAYDAPDDNPEVIALNRIIIKNNPNDEESKISLDNILVTSTDPHIKFSALAQKALDAANKLDFDLSRTYINRMEDCLLQNEGVFKDKLGNRFLRFKKYLLKVKIGRLSLKFRSENDEVTNAKSVSGIDRLDFKSLSNEIIIFNEYYPNLRLPETVTRYFSRALSNAAFLIQNDQPLVSIQLLKKALYYQEDYKLDKSITLFHFGCSYNSLSRIKDQQENLGKALYYFELARTSTTSPMLLQRIQDSLRDMIHDLWMRRAIQNYGQNR